jgi:hypothetical protein
MFTHYMRAPAARLSRCSSRAGIVACRERWHPKRHDGVTNVFVDDPAMAVNDLCDGAEIFVEKMNDGAGGELLADAGKLLDVRE